MQDKRGLIKALEQLKVETGSLACLGCGYEHNCSTKGCAILRKAEFAVGASPVYQCRNCDFYEGGLGSRCFNGKSSRAGRMVRREDSCDHCSIDLLTESEKARSDLAKKLAATVQELSQVKADRDAALRMVLRRCCTCKHDPDKEDRCNDCIHNPYNPDRFDEPDLWEWVGPRGCA